VTVLVDRLRCHRCLLTLQRSVPEMSIVQRTRPLLPCLPRICCRAVQASHKRLAHIASVTLEIFTRFLFFSKLYFDKSFSYVDRNSRLLNFLPLHPWATNKEAKWTCMECLTVQIHSSDKKNTKVGFRVKSAK